MIFLTVGTWRTGYDRLLEAVDELISSGIITEKVIAQIGYSSYKPKHMTVMDFCSPDAFVDIISEASLVISHAGMGTIIETVKRNKPLVAVPRKSELGEIDNDHQFITARQLEKEDKILVAYEVPELPERLKQAKTFIPAQGNDAQGIIDTVQKFIHNVTAKKNA